MKFYKKYGLEEKSYAESLTDNLESNRGRLSRQKTNYSYYSAIVQPLKIPQLFYQGNVYTHWREEQNKHSNQEEISPLGEEITRKHLENIRHRLEQRLKSAIARGDRQLISLLEKEGLLS